MFRSLRFVSQPLSRFHVLVGPNASGKTTFLDVIAFLGHVVSAGLDSAIEARTNNFEDLIWSRQGDGFELAVEAAIPADRLTPETAQFDTVRYEVSVALAPSGEPILLTEKVLLKTLRSAVLEELGQRRLFPEERPVPDSLVTPKGLRGTKTVVKMLLDGNVNFCDETGRGWDHAFKHCPRKSAQGNLPEDESRFPVATWLKSLLGGGIQ